MSQLARRTGRAVRCFLETRGDLAWLAGRSLRDLLALDLKRFSVLNEQVRLQIKFTGVDVLLLGARPLSHHSRHQRRHQVVEGNEDGRRAQGPGMPP